MDLNLTNKIILITGGYKGLGKSICRLYAEEGARVAINYRRNQDEAEALAAEIKAETPGDAVAVYADISSEEDVKAMFAQVEAAFGDKVDVLVNNAAYCPPAGPTANLPYEEIRKALDVNMAGMILCAREFLRRLDTEPGRRGKVVNISSQAAFRGSESGRTAYDATKLGIVGFTISLARELAARGINVNCVLPGLMYTDMLKAAIDADPVKYNGRIPMKRTGLTEEIAAVAVFLGSDKASYMTGATVDVSGGLAMH